jgi:uncharacterized protein (TIGR02145 family)
MGTSGLTLSLSLYRNTFTLTVSKGSNISAASATTAAVHGTNYYRWGQTVALSATKSTNVTCITYGNPTWTASTGTAPAAGATSSYTMPKSNATVTAASTATNVAQTITLSRTGSGANGINIAGTKYTGTSVSLTCGTYNISGSYDTGYGFNSWSRANGVAVASTTTASTTMTVTGAGTLTLSGKANQYTCTKRYRLQNADGTWGNYTTESAPSLDYNSTCSYEKTVTDYKNSASGTNGSKASGSCTVGTSGCTVSLDLYRNTYTLTVSKGSNISAASATTAAVHGTNYYRWGQGIALSATKTANSTCATYGNPTWTASAGTAPAAGATSSYTMPKSNTTVTAASTKSDVAQTITLSKGTGVTGINIGGTNRTGTSVSLNCGTYNISGNYTNGYEFSSWARANGVAVASTSSASTTMTVTGAGTLTLNGKAKTYSLTINFTANTGVSSVKVCKTSGNCSGSNLVNSVTSSGSSVSGLAYGTAYYLYPSFNSGYSFSAWAKTSGQGTLSATNTANPTFTMGVGNGTVTVTGKYGQCTNMSTCMQTYTNSMCSAGAASADVTLTDARDGKTYAARYINGKCWMVQNLAIAKGTTLTSVYSNVSSNYTIPNTDLTSGNSFTEGRSHAGTSGKTGTGYWYNYCAASAGTVCVGSSVSQDASYDICPAGWRLPTLTEIRGILSYSSAFSPIYGGEWYGGNNVSAEGGSAGWWTATARTDVFSDGEQYYLNWDDDYLSIVSVARDWGFFIRCIRSS